MYDWRSMTPREREEVLKWRKASELPWHCPPHVDFGEGAYLLSGTCFEHRPVIGASAKRMAEFEKALHEAVRPHVREIHAWCVLPNHYHLLTWTENVRAAVKAIGQFHGRQSFFWNGEDRTRGRQVWHSCQDRAMRSERHFWATMNYVHHNAVHHGYAACWEDWPYSSAAAFLESAGRDEALRIWREYPVLEYGKDWDPPRC